MNSDHHVWEEEGIVRVIYRGEICFERTSKMLRDVAQIAAAHQSSMLFVDARAVL